MREGVNRNLLLARQVHLGHALCDGCSSMVERQPQKKCHKGSIPFAHQSIIQLPVHVTGSRRTKMMNMKSLIAIYDWLTEQPGDESKKHAEDLEKLIFDDLMFREKILQSYTRHPDIES